MEIGFYKGKRILITGHTGFKGSWLTMILESLGAQVIGFSDAPLPGESLYSIVNPYIYATVWGDICDTELLKRTIIQYDIQYVFHFAAQTIVKIGIEQPFDTFRVNALGSTSILEAVRTCPNVEGILFVTTDKVYQDNGENVPYEETHKLWASSPYSASKCCAELAADTYYSTYWNEKRALGIAIVRAGNVIGGGDFAPYRIVPDCVRALCNKQPVVLRNPDAIRPYQWVLDTLFAYLDILKVVCESNHKSGPYNIGPLEAEYYSTTKLVELFFSFFDIPEPQYCYVPDANCKENIVLTLNSEKIQAVSQYKHIMNLSQAMKMTSKWYDVWMSSGDVRQCCYDQIAYHIKEGVCRGIFV